VIADATLRSRPSVGTLPLAIGVGALAAVLGAVRLEHRSLWVDESFTARATHKSYASLVHEDHWAYYSLVKAWTSVAGHSEWALRAPSVAAAALAAMLVYLLAVRLVGARAGLLAGLVAATNPFVVLWAQQARSYTILVLLTTAATYAFVLVLERPTVWRWIAYGGLVAAMLLCQVVSVLVLGAHVAAWLVTPGRPRLRTLAVVYAVVGLALAPWAFAVGHREASGGPTTWLSPPGAVDLLVAVVQLPGALGLGLLLAGFGLYHLLSERGLDQTTVLLGVWAVLPALTLLVGSLLKPVFVARYLITSTPAFAMLVGVAIAAVAYRPLLAGVLVLLGILLVAQLGVWYSHPSDTDWRGATRYVDAVRGRDPVLIAPFWAAPVYTYYAGGRIPPDTPSGRSVWVVSLGDDDAAMVQAAREVVHPPRYALLTSRSFGGHVSVQHWVRTAVAG